VLLVTEEDWLKDRPKFSLKQRFGDFEIDTIIGKNHKIFLVDHKTIEPLNYWEWNNKAKRN
jgi:hypothetical protein